MGTYETEVYFMTKNRDVLKISNIVKHVIYRVIESLAWGVRSRNLLVMLHGMIGLFKGFIRGYLYEPK
jgi:hypothetical protein